VAGANEAKIDLQEVWSPKNSPRNLNPVGAKYQRRAASWPTGTGKTMMARAVAGEANVPFFSISGSEFVEMFVGVGASRVRDLFAKAKKNHPV